MVETVSRTKCGVARPRSIGHNAAARRGASRGARRT
jgi:hypothetical protein